VVIILNDEIGRTGLNKAMMILCAKTYAVLKAKWKGAMRLNSKRWKRADSEETEARCFCEDGMVMI